MAAIVISDLPASSPLDRQAMKSIRGGGAPWVYGWIRPYSRATQGFGGVANFYQITNNFFADQMVNQFQTVDVRNSGSNSSINVNLAEDGRNFGHLAGPGQGGAA